MKRQKKIGLWIQCLSMTSIISCGQVDLGLVQNPNNTAALEESAKSQNITIKGTYKDTAAAQTPTALHLSQIDTFTCSAKKKEASETELRKCDVAIDSTDIVETDCKLANVAFGCKIDGVVIHFSIDGSDSTILSLGKGSVSLDLQYDSVNGTAVAVIASDSEAIAAAHNSTEGLLDTADISAFLNGSWEASCTGEGCDFDKIYANLIPEDVGDKHMIGLWDPDMALQCNAQDSIQFHFDGTELQFQDVKSLVDSIKEIYDGLSGDVRFVISDVTQKKRAAGAIIEAGKENYYAPTPGVGTTTAMPAPGGAPMPTPMPYQTPGGSTGNTTPNSQCSQLDKIYSVDNCALAVGYPYRDWNSTESYKQFVTRQGEEFKALYTDNNQGNNPKLVDENGWKRYASEVPSSWDPNYKEKKDITVLCVETDSYNASNQWTTTDTLRMNDRNGATVSYAFPTSSSDITTAYPALLKKALSVILEDKKQYDYRCVTNNYTTTPNNNYVPPMQPNSATPYYPPTHLSLFEDNIESVITYNGPSIPTTFIKEADIAELAILAEAIRLSSDKDSLEKECQRLNASYGKDAIAKADKSTKTQVQQYAKQEDPLVMALCDGRLKDLVAAKRCVPASVEFRPGQSMTNTAKMGELRCDGKPIEECFDGDLYIGRISGRFAHMELNALPEGGFSMSEESKDSQFIQRPGYNKPILCENIRQTSLNGFVPLNADGKIEGNSFEAELIEHEIPCEIRKYEQATGQESGADAPKPMDVKLNFEKR